MDLEAQLRSRMMSHESTESLYHRRMTSDELCSFDMLNTEVVDEILFAVIRRHLGVIVEQWDVISEWVDETGGHHAPGNPHFVTMIGPLCEDECGDSEGDIIPMLHWKTGALAEAMEIANTLTDAADWLEPENGVSG